jgi:hypothetical protein
VGAPCWLGWIVAAHNATRFAMVSQKKELTEEELAALHRWGRCKFWFDEDSSIAHKERVHLKKLHKNAQPHLFRFSGLSKFLPSSWQKKEQKKLNHKAAN